LSGDIVEAIRRGIASEVERSTGRGFEGLGNEFKKINDHFAQIEEEIKGLKKRLDSLEGRSK